MPSPLSLSLQMLTKLVIAVVPSNGLSKMTRRRPATTSSEELVFISAPLLITQHNSRQIRHHPPCIYASSSLDDDFFLPADRRQSHQRNPKVTASQSVSAHRLEQKGFDLRRFDDDDDEMRRSQMADEHLSAADLFGADTSDLLLGVDLDLDVSPPPPQKIEIDATSKPAASVSSEKKVSSQRKKPRTAKARNQVTQAPSPHTSSTNLQIGQLVKHDRHGIGRFLGLERTRATAADSSLFVQEYAVIEYRDGDVFVPLSHFDMLHPMVGDDAASVKRLDVISGSATFSNSGNSARSRRSSYLARRRTREKIRKQLVNLHGLYTERTTIDRNPFPVDVKEEKSFSKLCNFELTNDQKDATKQILSDMSSRTRPMDRLLCGDVGFGKTEVAIRAAFRVLRAGFQVAVLAPTTILAQQHFETFRDRLLRHYPEYKVACFNRFVPRKTLLANREAIANGELFIAIGTHMLLSDRMEFCNLGLLIVDEEHRFGVNQKEKIRARYRHVDSLFLSATPIPRTLHLSLSGLRDASVLRTPPSGRKPVVTKVSQSGAGIVREAIAHEVERGGQVFFVVPRIDGIESTATWIRDLFTPGAVRVTVAHGSSPDLEQKIWQFSQRNSDILVCTTIIENGIHMPGVNTIIIQDAGRFGLAQLHQLRGRVGRSEVQAYALVLYTNQYSANLPALQRLKALEENSDLGSGFAIAQRDMEMRGVGTILGVEQHGNTSVGADEYAKMLAEELEHARTGKPIPMTLPVTDSVEILLPVASSIPDEYINVLEAKMGMYKRMSDCQSKGQLDEVVADMERCYGNMPHDTALHVSLMEVKLFAKDLGIRRLMAERQHVILEWTLEAAVFDLLVSFLPDKLSKDRCEHIEAEERIVIRGLGICKGDVQLKKIRLYLECFEKAAVGFAREGTSKNEQSLSEALMLSTENAAS